jgi:hypothetical protein
MRGMILLSLLGAACAMAADGPPVMVTDYGTQTRLIGAGAPAHTIGLQLYQQNLVIDTGVKQYGLQYVVAHDERRPGVAIPGEGYIGMPQPSACNWYHGGFLDLEINGKTIGDTPAHSVTGRSAGDRGTVDFVFDTPMAVVRIRFVGLAGDDALYCQALLEPKEEITSLRLVLRCYPSAFVSNADRHVLTPLRDLPQGETADLDLAREDWAFYYDRIFDAGYVSPAQTGVGGCAALWPGGQTDRAGVGVGNYAIDTTMDLKPQQRDFRFVFFDFTGTKNAAAMAALRARADKLRQQLVSFPFTDASVAQWSLPAKQLEIAAVLKTVPEEQEAAGNYERWAVELAQQLALVRSGQSGAIMAEAEAAKVIQQWDRGLPELMLKAMLNEI